MLTIQPKFSTRPVAFRAETTASAPIDEERYYESKKEYYRQKIDEIDEAINDKNTPTFLKKMLKGFKIVSTAFLEGWAVAWGAKKGSNIIKSSVVKGAESKFAKGAKSVITPIGNGIGKVAKFISTSVSEGLTKLKATKFMQENSFGKILTKGIEYVESGFKYIGKKVSNWFAPIKEAGVDKTYDKATKVASSTLGVGAGVAGGYNAATDAENRKESETIHFDENDLPDEDEV